MAPEEVIQYLTGEQIVGGDISEDGMHIYTRNGLILVFIGTVGMVRTEDTVFH